MNHIYKDPDQVLRALAEFIAGRAADSIKRAGRFNLVLSGGSSPKKLYELLAADYRKKIDWTKVFFFFGDERYVPLDHPDSNFLMAKKALFAPLAIPDKQIFPINTSMSPEESATAYERDITKHFAGQPCQFDVILLGLGDNSHTASLFPHTSILHEKTRLVKDIFVEEVKMNRITFTAPLINAARDVAFLVYGAGKAEAVKHILEEPTDIDAYPAQLIRPAGGVLHWFMDEPAAAKIQSRQLAAIMFTDIVGYTALMGKDERNAFTLLNKNRQLQKPIISEFHGRWIKELGDGTMASFNTVSDAVNAAIKIQEACHAAKSFELRIGIHQGEVVFENDDVFGDAVNIAARIQAAASPGCILISETVNHNISNKKEIKTQFVKEAILKNVNQPVKMYQVIVEGSKIMASEKPGAAVVENSIAVLPFANMSSDPEQEFFSDGISEEIINMLAQMPELKVIGRTSAFAFKGMNLDLKVIGDQLKVSHILEGSVRRSGNKLRVTAQLISVADGFHLYSEKFDRELEDIFAIQDELSLAILNAVKIRLFGAKKDAVLKRYTDNVEAYQLYLKAKFHYNKYTPDAFMKAIDYLHEAIRIEPGYAIAYSSLSYCYLTLWYFNWMPAEHCLPQGLKAAKQSIQLDNEIAESHLCHGRVKLHYELKIREASIEYKKSLAINPNSAECHVQLGMCAALLGNYEEANEHAQKADGLDPFSLMNMFFISAICWATADYEKLFAYGKRIVDMESRFFGGHLMLGTYYLAEKRYDESIIAYELGVTLNPDMMSLEALAHAYAKAGQKVKAREVIERMKTIERSGTAGNSFLGIAYVALGELDTAFEYFNKAIDNNEGHSLFLKASVRLIPEFMEDPRATRLFERIGVV